MEDRENQQVIVKETDKAWLAGFLEGDGYITMSSYLAAKKKKDSGLVVSPVIGFSNQDALLIERAKKICDALAGGGVWLSENNKDFAYSYPSKYNTVINLSVRRLSACSKILEALIPYLAGQKAARARLLLEFVNRRMSHPSQPYDSEEIGMVRTFVEEYVHTKGPRRGKTLRKFLRDHTLDVPRPRNELGRFASAA